MGLPRLFSRLSEDSISSQFFQIRFAFSETGPRKDRSDGGPDLRESADHGTLRDMGELARGEGGVEAGQTGDRRLERVHHPEKQFHGQQTASDPWQGRQWEEINLQGRESQISRRGPRADRDRGRCL